MANSLKLANHVELRCLWARWPQLCLDLSPLDNYDIIGAVALFGRHGVKWGDLAVTAKSPQVVCHLPDVTPLPVTRMSASARQSEKDSQVCSANKDSSFPPSFALPCPHSGR